MDYNIPSAARDDFLQPTNHYPSEPRVGHRNNGRAYSVVSESRSAVNDDMQFYIVFSNLAVGGVFVVSLPFQLNRASNERRNWSVGICGLVDVLRSIFGLGENI
mmetsp:Transcript_5365/g.15583  ORF Transcript_5365/g.15583 Transcript_5365/m.15583 type:complete len:104 (+) Transcript_5365:1887-2198(+)